MWQCAGELSRPGALDALGRGKDGRAFSSQPIQRRACVPRVALGHHEPAFHQQIELLLRALTGHPHRGGQLGRGAWRIRNGNGPEHLPSSARQIQVPDELIAGRQQLPVYAENQENHIREHVSRRAARSRRYLCHDN
jgi:hypothetical protein